MTEISEYSHTHTETLLGSVSCYIFFDFTRFFGIARGSPRDVAPELNCRCDDITVRYKTVSYKTVRVTKRYVLQTVRVTKRYALQNDQCYKTVTLQNDVLQNGTLQNSTYYKTVHFILYYEGTNPWIT